MAFVKSLKVTLNPSGLAGSKTSGLAVPKQHLPNILLCEELLLELIRMSFMKECTGKGWEKEALVVRSIPY